MDSDSHLWHSILKYIKPMSSKLTKLWFFVSEASSLLFQKFIDGFEVNKTYTAADNATLAKLTNLTKAVYNWTEKEPFYRYSSQKCEDMIISLRKSISCLLTVRIPNVFLYFHLVWADTNSQRFYSAFQAITDYGACCLIIPYLDLVNMAHTCF